MKREMMYFAAFVSLTAGSLSACKEETQAPSPAPAQQTSQSSSEDAGETDVSSPPSPPTVVDGCAFPSPRGSTSPCPSTCLTVEAMEADEERACRRKVVLGCLPPGGGGDTSGPCFKNTQDGRMVQASRFVFVNRPEWVECSLTEYEQLPGAICAD